MRALIKQFFLQSDEWLELNELLYDAVGVRLNDKKKNQYYCLGILNNRILSILDGPHIVDLDNMESLVSFSKQLQVHEVNLKPKQIYIKFPAVHIGSNFKNRDQVLRDIGFKKQQWLTAFVDLTYEKDFLFKLIEHSARKSIKKCQRLGLAVSRCRNYEEFIEKFCNGYLNNSNKIWSPKLKYKYDCMWSLHERVYQFFYIEYDGMVIATLGAYQYGDHATEIMSSIASNARKLKLPAQDILHWEVFNFYRELGLKKFDLAGYSPSPLSTKEHGIMKFKKKWGVVEMRADIFTKDISFFQFIKSFLRKIYA